MAPHARERHALRDGVPTPAEVAAAPAPERAPLALRRELSRKALHVASAVLPVGWGLGVLSPERLRLLLTLALVIAILVEGARHLSPPAAARFDRWFGSMLRPHERGGLTGATWLAASMLGAMIVFPPAAAVVALWAVAAGDGAASIVGRVVASRQGAARVGKTFAGTLACALVTAAGALWLVRAPWGIALLLGAVAAIAERPRGPLDDNLRVAALTGLAAWGLGLA